MNFQHGGLPQVTIDFPGHLAQTIAYNGDGTIDYVEATNGSVTWRQTYTYTSGQLVGISAWEVQ